MTSPTRSTDISKPLIVKQRKTTIQPEIEFCCVHYQEGEAGYVHRFIGIDKLNKLAIVCAECHDVFSPNSFVDYVK